MPPSAGSGWVTDDIAEIPFFSCASEVSVFRPRKRCSLRSRFCVREKAKSYGVDEVVSVALSQEGHITCNPPREPKNDYSSSYLGRPPWSAVVPCPFARRSDGSGNFEVAASPTRSLLHQDFVGLLDKLESEVQAPQIERAGKGTTVIRWGCRWLHKICHQDQKIRYWTSL